MCSSKPQLSAADSAAPISPPAESFEHVTQGWELDGGKQPIGHVESQPCELLSHDDLLEDNCFEVICYLSFGQPQKVANPSTSHFACLLISGKAESSRVCSGLRYEHLCVRVLKIGDTKRWFAACFGVTLQKGCPPKHAQLCVVQ